MSLANKSSRASVFEGEAAQSGDVKLDDLDRVYVAEGDVLVEKYRVERTLGIGGMGFVVAARHLELDGMFALKFLKKRFLRDERVVERFTREARAACRIRSEYVARVYDVGTCGGVPFLVMDHLVGRDLAAVLADTGWLGIEEAVEYAIQACAALTVAHGHGIVHRDIKPENLFLVEHEGHHSVKLLDFGISRVALTDGNSQFESGRLTGSLALGTPLYMSPEQIRSTASADAPSDQWSLGVVLYELLTATAAFQADSVAEVCAAILEREPRPLTELRPEVPVGLAEVVGRCLQKEAVHRFRTVAELAVALLPFAPLRALAVAESSSSIRRAAIHSLGAHSLAMSGHPSQAGLGTSTRISLSGGLPVRSGTPARESLSHAIPNSPTTKRGRMALGAAAAIVIAAAASGAMALREQGGSHTTRDRSGGTGASATPAPNDPSTNQWRPASPPHGSDDSAEPTMLAAKSKPTPQARPTASAHLTGPTPPNKTNVVRVSPAPKLGSADSTAAVATTSSAVPALPPARGRPDLGY